MGMGVLLCMCDSRATVVSNSHSMYGVDQTHHRSETSSYLGSKSAFRIFIPACLFFFLQSGVKAHVMSL